MGGDKIRSWLEFLKSGDSSIWALFYAALGLGVLVLAVVLTIRVIRNGLLRKELRHFFASPIAWLVMGGFAFVNGFVFMFIVDHYSGFAPNEPLPRLLFGNGFFWILQFIVIPAITMRLIAEERASGTLETLMTAPVTDGEVVFAKYAAALVFYAALWVPTFVHVGMAYYYGVPDDFLKRVGEDAAKTAGGGASTLALILPFTRAFFQELNATMDFGPIFSSYLGILLMGSAWLAVGVLASAFTRNQVVAFVTAFVLTIMSFAIGFTQALLPTASPWITETLRYVSFQNAYEPFPRGLIDSRAVVYFVSLTVLMLFLSVRAVESRKWR